MVKDGLVLSSFLVIISILRVDACSNLSAHPLTDCANERERRSDQMRFQPDPARKHTLDENAHFVRIYSYKRRKCKLFSVVCYKYTSTELFS